MVQKCYNGTKADGAVELYHNNSTENLRQDIVRAVLVTGTLRCRQVLLVTYQHGNVTGNASVAGIRLTLTQLEMQRQQQSFRNCKNYSWCFSFDGTANISLNNNAITNGAGYITATLTNEQVQDIVGGMLSSNTETGITVNVSR